MGLKLEQLNEVSRSIVVLFGIVNKAIFCQLHNLMVNRLLKDQT